MIEIPIWLFVILTIISSGVVGGLMGILFVEGLWYFIERKNRK